MEDKEKIESCYRRMYRGMVDKDRALLSEILEPGDADIWRITEAKASTY